MLPLHSWADLESLQTGLAITPLLDGIEEAVARPSTPKRPSPPEQEVGPSHPIVSKKRKNNLPTKPEERMANPEDPIKHLERAIKHIQQARQPELVPNEQRYGP
jgi:hypothetical protein